MSGNVTKTLLRLSLQIYVPAIRIPKGIVISRCFSMCNTDISPIYCCQCITDYTCGVVHTKQYYKLNTNNWQSCIDGEMYIIKRRKMKNVHSQEKQH